MTPETLIQKAAADPVALENAFHQAMMRVQGDYLSQLGESWVRTGDLLADLWPPFSSTLVLGMLLFLAAYLASPTPAIALPGRGAFGVPANRRRKHRRK